MNRWGEPFMAEHTDAHPLDMHRRDAEVGTTVAGEAAFVNWFNLWLPTAFPGNNSSATQ